MGLSRLELTVITALTLLQVGTAVRTSAFNQNQPRQLTNNPSSTLLPVSSFTHVPIPISNPANSLDPDLPSSHSYPGPDHRLIPVSLVHGLVSLLCVSLILPLSSIILPLLRLRAARRGQPSPESRSQPNASDEWPLHARTSSSTQRGIRIPNAQVFTTWLQAAGLLLLTVACGLGIWLSYLTPHPTHIPHRSISRRQSGPPKVPSSEPHIILGVIVLLLFFLQPVLSLLLKRLQARSQARALSTASTWPTATPWARTSPTPTQSTASLGSSFVIHHLSTQPRRASVAPAPIRILTQVTKFYGVVLLIFGVLCTVLGIRDSGSSQGPRAWIKAMPYALVGTVVIFIYVILGVCFCVLKRSARKAARNRSSIGSDSGGDSEHVDEEKSVTTKDSRGKLSKKEKGWERGTMERRVNVGNERVSLEDVREQVTGDKAAKAEEINPKGMVKGSVSAEGTKEKETEQEVPEERKQPNDKSVDRDGGVALNSTERAKEGVPF